MGENNPAPESATDRVRLFSSRAVRKFHPGAPSGKIAKACGLKLADG